MWWQYLLVFMGGLLMDITPLPLPPAFTVMIFFQIIFGLPVLPVIIMGVLGSILGRYILTLYISDVSGRIFKTTKNEDIQFLGEKLKSTGWKSQLFIVLYTLMPLPSTPLFVAAGIAKMRPVYIFPAFFVGKFTSDCLAVFVGKVASENTESIINGILSWQSIAGMLLGFLLLFSLIFIDWRSLLQHKKFRLEFNVWK